MTGVSRLIPAAVTVGLIVLLGQPWLLVAYFLAAMLTAKLWQRHDIKNHPRWKADFCLYFGMALLALPVMPIMLPAMFLSGVLAGRVEK